MNILTILTALFTGISAHARDARCEGDLDGMTMPREIRMVVWNVHKFKNPASVNDLARLSQAADLVLLQEFTVSGLFSGPLLDIQPNIFWKTSISFKKKQDFTGVSTGSPYIASNTETWTSEATEPFVRTPKAMLYSQFRVEGSEEKLLVINVHGLNFVRTETFRQHMRQIIQRIEQHKGPVIAAGDYNTWSPGRMTFLKASLNEVGLSHLHTSGGLLKLDHIFARGVELVKVEDTSHFKSSDHAAMAVEMRIQPNL